MMVTVLGWTECPKCDKCGREDLKRTMAIEHEDGEIAHYGSECVKKVLGVKGAKEATNRADIISTLQTVYTKAGWRAAVRWSWRYGWQNDEKANVIRDGNGKPLLSRTA